MAKQQTFGDSALQKKLAARKMAKVIVSQKNEKGTFSFRESTISAEGVQDFIKANKA